MNMTPARIGLLCGTVIGLVAGSSFPLLAGTSTKRLLLAAMGMIAVLIVLLAKNRTRWFLGGLILLMPVNVNYFLFQRYAPHIGGAPGLYLVACDLPLLVLYGLWFVEVALPEATREKRSAWYFWLYVPFLFLAGMSILHAVNSAWASYELLRWVRVALILFYASQKVKLADVEFCLYCLAGTVLIQGGISALQTLFRTNFAMERLGIAGRGSESVFEQEVGNLGTVVRGAGTMGHPNILGQYLVMIVPLFVMLALVDSNRRRSRYWSAASVAGIAGLACTLSRASWVSFAVGSLAAAAMLWLLRLIEPKRIVTRAFTGLAAMILIAAPFSSLIAKRFETDYSDSVRFRLELNQVATHILKDHLLLGVGINNFTVISPKYIPPEKSYLESLEGLVPAVHNLYLLVASELGVSGLAAFLLFWVGSFVRALRKPSRIQPLARAAIAGLACGFIGMLFGDFAGFALWTDANLWTGALMIGLFEPLEALRL
jgi:O-antigen ligase